MSLVSRLLNSLHTFLLSVWLSCWLSSSALHLLGHRLGLCPRVLGSRPGMKGTGMEGAEPRCRTTSEAHGVHRSDKEPPEHSSVREVSNYVWCSVWDIDVNIMSRFLTCFSQNLLHKSRFRSFNDINLTFNGDPSSTNDWHSVQR